MTNYSIIHGDSFEVAKSLADESVDMIYIDPPFGTGVTQTSKSNSYCDKKQDIANWLNPLIKDCKRILKQSGYLCLHLDYRYSHSVKLMLDSIFNEDNFVNEIIWSYNFGGRSKDCWPKKHDSIFVYSKNKNARNFYVEQSDRIPYKTPALQYLNRSKETAEKRIELGQIPTDVWTDIPIIGTQSKERVDYPTQKPVKLVERFIKSLTKVNDLVVDFFAGSGTTGVACKNLSRQFILVDQNESAIDIINCRISNETYTSTK